MLKYLICTLLTLFIQLCITASPFEYAVPFDRSQPLNRVLYKHWQQNDIPEPVPASDAVFLRRVALTLCGRLPSAGEVSDFLCDDTPNKRKKFIEKLLDSAEYADMQAMRFADMLRIKSEFPINLWPNAVQFYHRKVHDDLASDRSLQEMFYEMLTVSGSNFREPYANFFRASADRSPEGLAKMVLLTTMNMRESEYSSSELAAFARLFSCIRYKSTYEWKEEIVYNAIEPVCFDAMLPDGTTVNIDNSKIDPRKVFADWLLKGDQKYFERAIANKVWYWVFGAGISPEADALPKIRDSFWTRLFSGAETNPAFSEDVQNFLITELKQNNYSLKQLYRVILNSAAFQASSLQQEPEKVKHFAAYPVRRLEYELLIDALSGITGGFDRYMSVIPEPFTYLPGNTKAVNIADGSISSGVLDSFGRPPRDSGQNSERKRISSDNQNLYTMNSTALHRRITNYCNTLARNIRNEDERLKKIYLDCLSRYPTLREKELFKKYQQALEPAKRHLAWSDTVWVIFNSTEFTFYH